jgi:transcriptional regulator with XRE-family HTH domain
MSAKRYNIGGGIAMNINVLLDERKMTKYRLSKMSGVPHTTINDICNDRVRLEKCSAETLYKLAGVLGVSLDSLVADAMEYRSSFETYKSNVCHRVKDMGDMNFIIDILESGEIRRLYQKRWYPESLYLLAMVDYLSRENGLPLCNEYSDIRKARLKEVFYPAGILTMCAASNSDIPKQESLREAIPEFMRFNIVESEVRNVY